MKKLLTEALTFQALIENLAQYQSWKNTFQYAKDHDSILDHWLFRTDSTAAASATCNILQNLTFCNYMENAQKIDLVIKRLEKLGNSKTVIADLKDLHHKMNEAFTTYQTTFEPETNAMDNRKFEIELGMEFNQRK